jgi:LmbE family N-acetylglucosaminyl deacetylase
MEICSICWPWIGNLSDKSKMAERALAIVAHPDDIEFNMAGTMMLLHAAGYELHYMSIANGSCGSTRHDTATIVRLRRAEAQRAADFLGATYHESLTNDLEIFYDLPTLQRLGSVIRHVGPKILLVHSPQDYMEDHTNACRLAITAAFSRGMPNFPVLPPRPAVQQDVTIYHAQPHGNCDPLGAPVLPEIFVDISSVIDRKAQMLSFHESQRDWLDESQGMDSYIATMRQLSQAVGELSQTFSVAEGWRRHSHLGFCAPDANPLVDALRPYVKYRT